MDGAMTKPPLGGPATGSNSTDPVMNGVPRSVLTDGAGVIIRLLVGPANRNDRRLLEETHESRRIPPPPDTSQHMCLDRGCDYPGIPRIVDEWTQTASLREVAVLPEAVLQRRVKSALRQLVQS